MRVIRTYVPDSFQNFNHLVVCEQTRQAAAVDPYDAAHLLALARDRDLSIAAVWVTHEHPDHTRHVDELKRLTGAAVYAPVTCQGRLDADVWLDDGDRVTLGEEHADFWLTPGHTPGHGMYYATRPEPFLICGDTLFNAGVGNTRSGSTEVLFDSIERVRARTDPAARIYPGHDYLPNNIAFTLSLLPDLEPAQRLQREAARQEPDTRATTTMDEEYDINLFLRLEDPDLIKALENKGFNTESLEDRFTALRQLRDKW